MSFLELKLRSCNIKAQFDFYTKVLGWEPILHREGQICFQLGSSVLTLVADEEATPYHYAINIPSHGEQQALKWLQKRVEVLKGDGEEIVDFSAWNARALYFYDADRNIVEFIARRNLEHPQHCEFGQDSLYEISEVGVASQNLQDICSFLHLKLGLEKFSGNMDNFCAIGEETGLFICIDRNQKQWFPNDDQALPSAFETKVSHQGKQYELCFTGEQMKLLHGY